MDSPEGASLGLSSDQWALEVSSPGINRTLKRAEHFDGACGERISVRFNPDVAQFVVQETSLNLQKRTKKNQSPAQRAERAEKLIATVKKKRVLQGPLVAAMPEHLEVQDDEGLLLVHIPRRAVVHARVDFLFDQR
jgi:ribosome maturation factor RimP